MAKKKPEQQLRNGEQIPVAKKAKHGAASAAAIRKKQKSDPTSTTNRVVPYVLAVIGLLLFLSLLIPDDIPASGFFCGLMRGGFSVVGWCVPVLFLIAAFRFRADHAAEKLTERVVFSALTLVFASALLHLTVRAELSAFAVRPLYEAGCELRGGGLIGGLACNAVYAVLGLPGVLVLGVFGTLFSVLMLFGVTPLAALRYLAASAKKNNKPAASAEPPAPAAEPAPASAPAAEPTVVPAPQAQPISAAEANISATMLPRGWRTGDAPIVVQPQTRQAAPAPQFEMPTNGARSPFSPVGAAGIYARHTADPAAIDAAEDAEALDLLATPDGNLRYTTRVDVPFSEDYSEERAPAPAPAVVRSPFGMNQPTMRPAPAPTQPSAPAVPAPTPVMEAEPEDEETDEMLVAPSPAPAPAPAPRPAPTVMQPPRPPVQPAPAQQPAPAPAPAAPVHRPSMVYTKPPLSLLPPDKALDETQGMTLRQQMGQRLVEILADFRVPTRLVHVSNGPTVLRFELVPEQGVTVKKISGLVDDIALHMASKSVRLQLPVPGKSVVGVELPNPSPRAVALRNLLEHPTFQNAESKLTIAVGRDVAGEPVFGDLAKMPHLLVAGATGAGKSVCMNTMIVSLLYKATPEEVRLILIDPKKIEFAIYDGLPHLLIPVVTEPKKAAGALRWAVGEMEGRLDTFSTLSRKLGRGIPNIFVYNKIMREQGMPTMPQIVIFIDELADLMLTAPADVEASIQRLTQLARAMGIHLVLGTQRPSVDVITGVIKSNVPSRVAFSVASNVDSRTILDRAGAEKLVGKGDMLYAPVGEPEPRRVQGAFVDGSEEVGNVVEFIKQYSAAQYDEEVMARIEQEAAQCGQDKKGAAGELSDGGADDMLGDDPLFWDVLQFAVENGKLSTSLLSRKFRLGYNRAARLVDQMEALGFISPADGVKPREVKITMEQFYEYKNNHGDDEY